MIKKLIFITIVFVFCFFYLNQKVCIYVQAYKLNESYNRYQKLVDCRDYLLYNFTKRVSLEEVNFWVEANGYRFASERKVLALGTDTGRSLSNRQSSNSNKFASFFNRIFRDSFASGILAQERQ